MISATITVILKKIIVIAVMITMRMITTTATNLETIRNIMIMMMVRIIIKG